MKTLAELTRQAAADLTAARLIQKEIESLIFAPVGTAAQEAATTTRILELKQALKRR